MQLHRLTGFIVLVCSATLLGDDKNDPAPILCRGYYQSEEDAIEQLARMAATYSHLDEWKDRAAKVRKQILVGANLDPLPKRTPLNPITSAIMNGATYVARGYSGDIKHLNELIKGAIQHRGFALVDIFSPCTTFNKDNDHPFFKQRVKKLEEEGHDTSDWKAACEKAMLWGDTIYTGLFMQRPGEPTLGDRERVLNEGGPLAHRPLGLSEKQAEKIITRMM